MSHHRRSSSRFPLLFALAILYSGFLAHSNNNNIINNNNSNGCSSTKNASFYSVSAMSTKSTATYRGALIFMHGLGDTPRGWMSLEQQLPRLKPRLNADDVKYVFPAAPTIPITINGGSSMPGWFDLYDWPIGVGSKDDPAGLMKGVEQIKAEVERLQTEEGIPPNKIVVGGFSQGGAVALLSCYHQNLQKGAGAEAKPFAGCAGLSAWLTLPKEVAELTDNGNNKEDPRTKIPLFWGHGTYDDKVLFEQQQFGIETLTNEFGLDWNRITSTQYPMGHQSCEQETKDLADFVDRALFGDVCDDDAEKDA